MDTWILHSWNNGRTPWIGTYRYRDDRREWISHIFFIICIFFLNHTCCILCYAMEKATIEDGIWPWEGALYCYKNTQVICIVCLEFVGFSFPHLSRACKIMCISCSSKISQRKSKVQSNNEIYLADHSADMTQKGPLSGICGASSIDFWLFHNCNFFFSSFSFCLLDVEEGRWKRCLKIWHFIFSNQRGCAGRWMVTIRLSVG